MAAVKAVAAVETALAMIGEGLDMGVASFNMTEADIETFMRDPYVMTSSDGSGRPSAAVRHVSAQDPPLCARHAGDHDAADGAGVGGAGGGDVTASRIGGCCAAGAFADVIVFDPETIREEATYAEPTKLATGMRWVFVNGRAAVRDGRLTGVMAGRGLLRARPAAPVGGRR